MPGLKAIFPPLMLAEFLKNTVGHTKINSQGEFERWLINRDVGSLSRLALIGNEREFRIPRYNHSGKAQSDLAVGVCQLSFLSNLREAEFMQ